MSSGRGAVRAGRLTADELAWWVAASCARHGVPVKVTDPLVLVRVAVLLSDDAAPNATRVVAARSEPPDGIDPVGVDRAGAEGAGSDNGMVKQRTHDGVLTVKVEAGPLSA